MPLFSSGASGVQESSPFAQAERAQTLTPTFGQEFEALQATGPTAMIGRAFQRQLPYLQGKTMDEPYEAPAVLNKRYGVPDGESWFNEALPDSVAQVVAEQKKDELKRNEVLDSFAQGHNWAQNFGIGTLGFIADPIDAVSMFVPGLGEDAIMAKLGATAAGRFGGRIIVGAEAGALSQAAVSGLKAPLSLDDDDYSLRQAIDDVFFGAVLGAGGHALIGTGLDATSRGRARIALDHVARMDARAKSDAMRGGLVDRLEGRPINVQGIIDNEDPVTFARNAQERNAAGPAENMVPSELEAAHSEVYAEPTEKVEPLQPTAPEEGEAGLVEGKQGPEEAKPVGAIEAPKAAEGLEPTAAPEIERVGPAAIRVNGKIYTGNDHVSISSSEPGTRAAGREEGFVTSTGRFVSKDEAKALHTAEAAPEGSAEGLARADQGESVAAPEIIKPAKAEGEKPAAKAETAKPEVEKVELDPDVQMALNEIKAMGVVPQELLDELSKVPPNYVEAYLQAIECTAGAVV